MKNLTEKDAEIRFLLSEVDYFHNLFVEWKAWCREAWQDVDWCKKRIRVLEEEVSSLKG